MPTPTKPRLDQSPNHKLVYGLIVLGTLLVFAMLAQLPAQRVGDGSEYYALFYAWKETLRPWMSGPSYEAYQNLFLSNQIRDMVPADWFASVFPALVRGDTADFNHFWFYSFLAYVLAKVVGIVGINLAPHTAFLGLHFILVSLTGCVSYYLYGKRGLATFVIMTLFSPMLWFYDKVHTEVFTYCLTFIGVMLVFSRYYLLAALMFALAATQNPSFALVAFVPFAYRFILQRAQAFSIFEVCVVVATAFAVLAHPIYYFCRLGVLTPQLLAGGAKLGGNLSTFYIWLIDPDLGLLPNWHLGLIMIVAAIIARLCLVQVKDEAPKVAFYVFLGIFLLVNFYANGSTVNLNSGATPGLARYALWYLPAAFPVCYYVMRHMDQSKAFAIPLVLLIVAAGAYSIKRYNPAKPEDYTTPSRLSKMIQKRAPFLYNPPAEVFAERYSGKGEAIVFSNPRGIIGPDCRKILLYAGEGRQLVTASAKCKFDQAKLEAQVNARWSATQADHYDRLNDDQYNEARAN